MIKISKKEACRFLVAYHQFNSFPSTIEGIESVFRHLQSIQIDPLNIVARNHQLVLQSRIRNYKQNLLNKALYKNRILIEGWEKQASIHLTKDWPYFQRRREAYKRYIQESARGKQLTDILPFVRKELKERGALSSKDIESDVTVDWHWAPSSAVRAALEALLDMGEAVIVKRENNRKVYQLTEDIVSKNLLTRQEPNPTEEEYNDFRIERRIRSIGLIWDKSGQAWLDTCKSIARKESLIRLLDEGRIREVKIEGIAASCFIPETAEEHLEANPKKQVVFLAPLDNMIWDRDFIKEIFDFEYTWEVYKPAKQRKYGHYVLPILYGDRFVGRFEPVVERKKISNSRKKDESKNNEQKNNRGNKLKVKNLWWEKDTTSKSLKEKYEKNLEKFRVFAERD